MQTPPLPSKQGPLHEVLVNNEWKQIFAAMFVIFYIHAFRFFRHQVIAAQGENNASRALKEAADTISESPTALQLRYLQTLNTISAEKNSTIIFPLPIDLLR